MGRRARVEPVKPRRGRKRKRGVEPVEATRREVEGEPETRPAPLQTVAKVRCPVCRRDQLVSNGTRVYEGVTYRYYRCKLCCDPETLDWTTFKVRASDPLARS